MKIRNSHEPSSLNPRFTVAIVEGDDVIREELATWVAEMGHTPAPFATVAALLAAMRTKNGASNGATKFSLLLLDCGLPDMQGLEFLRQLRADARFEAPIILCAARGREAQAVEALRAGTDDFIVKSVRRSELAARVSAALHRAYPTPANTGVLSVPPYAIDLATRLIHADGQQIELQNREFALAVMLFRNLNGVVSRARIIQTLWAGESMETSRSLDTHVSRVRRKLGLTPERGLILQSVYGLGYRLQAVAVLIAPQD